jgi:dTDP-4-amino-4,6-dideoxygalactose transaminase
MSKDKYVAAAAELMRLFGGVSEESAKMTAKLNGYSERLSGINRNLNAQHAAAFDRVVEESAEDFELYADALKRIAERFPANLHLLAEGFTKYVGDISLETEHGKNELAAMRSEIRGLLETAAGTKGKVAFMRSAVQPLRDSNWSPRLTQAASKLLLVIDGLFSAYEEFETFALKIAFAVEER